MRNYGKRFLAMVLTLCLLLALIPVYQPVEVEAALDFSSLTCSSFISNSIAQKYIDTMMKYYINNNSSLQSTLTSGKSVVFMFEGGSDNYWNGSAYQDVLYSTRNQAVVIVVQLDSSGVPYIAFYCENCSSIPDDPDWCTYNVGNYQSTTLMDGIYSFYTWNHTGPYAAFQISASTGYYTPTSYPNGQVLGASGINIHTRNLNNCGGKSVGWCRSAGCQLIGSGYDTSNEFNQFMKVVGGITWNSWISYSSGTYNTWATTGTTKGYYVLDRQLGMMGTDGTQYGDGSLIELYNSTALTNITAKSTTARDASGFSMDYVDQCERFASNCTLEVTLDQCQLRGAPCSEGTDESSTLIENLSVGDELKAIGIYKNHYGNYWYEVIAPSGNQGFIYGENAKYIEDDISDIVLTDATPPNGHVKGATFYVNGTIKSEYNELTSVACYIYNDFSTEGDPVTGASDTPSTNSYTLAYSDVDDATWMATLAVGNYTYGLYASYANYYCTDATTLQSNTGTITLMEEIFAVIEAEADQASCAHTETTYELTTSTCTSNGSSVTICSTCGLVTEKTTVGAHSYGDWSTTKQATCVAEGSQSRTCTACGYVQTQSIAPVGHNYSSEIFAATCLEYERIAYTCTVCGHSYNVYADELMTEWSESIPEGIDESLWEVKTQYRYSDYETVTSDSSTLDGYTQIDKQWKQSSAGAIQSVDEWPSGFLTTHELYSKYTCSSFMPTQTDSFKREMGDETLIGYVYYHWCYGTYLYGPTNRTTSKTADDTHSTFHAHYVDIDTLDPTTLTPASDGSITYAVASACTDSWWWYYIPVYEHSYVDYRAEYTHERWTDWSEWSDTAATASDTRQVETRTMYRYADAQLGDHSWSEGTCSVCGLVCEHSYTDGICTVCGMEEPVTDFYLFGFINGANYACEENYEDLGEYLFVDGSLTVQFQQDSYVAVKAADNQNWYMTSGWLGFEARSAVLHNTSTLSNADKLYVPGGVEVCFTLVDNEDDTFTLSYVITSCPHASHDASGNCVICGTAVSHSYQSSTTAPTCSADGYTTNTCAICGSSYVSNWISATGHSYNAVVTSPTCTSDGYTTYTCTACGTSYIDKITNATGHSYVDGICTACGASDGSQIVAPTITLSYPTLSFEDQIQYNVYFTLSDLSNVAEMGLITFDSKLTDGTIADAVEVIPGYTTSGSYYIVHSNGVPAKNLGDALYFKVYAKLTDGSYIYTNVAGYNAVAYAKTILGSSSTSMDAKRLMVAMLNYGAEAQLHFNYNTDALINSFLTDPARALVADYDESMVDDVVAADDARAGHFVMQSGSFTSIYPTVSFEGAFSVNYYFANGLEADSGLTFVYWDADTYNSVEKLTTANATGMMKMTQEGDLWTAAVAGIAAKDIDQTIYVVAIYKSGGTAYTSKVIPYSIGKYCETIAANGNSFGAATAVYGYYAKTYFANL